MELKRKIKEQVKNIPFLYKILVFMIHLIWKYPKKSIVDFYYFIKFGEKSLFYKRFVWKYKNKKIDYNGKTIFFIFGGRKDRMYFLMHYVEKLLAQKQIDYVHIWNVARNKQDYKWLKSLEDESKGIFVFSLKKFYKKINEVYFEFRSWYSIYHYYNDEPFKTSLFVKCDDDIVYIDTGQFSSFTDKIKNITPDSKHYMVSANVVNNGVCAYLQQKRGLIPKSLEVFDFPNDNNLLGLAGENYWNEGKKSQELHKYFIQNRRSFVAKSKTLPIELVDIGIRFSINLIGFKQKTIDNMLKYFYNGDSDEFSLSVELSKFLNKKIMIDMSFVASHLSFSFQLKQDDKKLLFEYDELFREVLNQS